MQALTLYDNPIETIQQYRLWVLGVMYTYNENLRRLDQVLITNREFDKVLVWKENIFSGRYKRLRKLEPANKKQPPALPSNFEQSPLFESGATSQYFRLQPKETQ